MLWREILASRRERGLPTLACFVDVRKAYDTVWREGAYVRIREGGVRGKLWRQLQTMYADTNRSVLHPVGRTQPSNVERGVPESSRVTMGLLPVHRWPGTRPQVGRPRSVGSRSSSAVVDVRIRRQHGLHGELGDHERATSHDGHRFTFVKKNRFQFNDKKSAVMVVNAKARLRAEAAREAWSLAGEPVREPVKVKDKYVYLGTTSTTNEKDWSTHLRLTIALLRVLRLDKGMRSRTAIQSACGSPWFAPSLSMLARYGTGRCRPPW